MPLRHQKNQTLHQVINERRRHQRPLIRIVQRHHPRSPVQRRFAGRFNRRKVRAIRKNVRRFRIVETVVGVVDMAAVGNRLYVRHVAERSTRVFDEVVKRFEFADQPEGGGEDPERFERFGSCGRVVVAAVADALLVPVVGEVENGVNGAGNTCPDDVHTVGQERAAEIGDVNTDVGLEAGFDIDGDGIKSPDRCFGGDVSGAGEEFEENGAGLQSSYVKNVRCSGHVF